MPRILAGCTLSVVLLFCGMVAMNRGLASLYANPGKSSLTVMHEEKRKVQQPDWKAIRSSLEQAWSYDERNPDLLGLLGNADEGEVAFYPVGDPAAGRPRDRARQYYLAALAGRPTWPHDWMALALVKYRLGQIDADFHHALRTALALGPWEPSVQYVIADIGMHHWDRFDDGTHQLVLGVVRDGMEVMPMDLARLARRYDMLELVCDGGVKDEQVIKYCKQNLRR